MQYDVKIADLLHIRAEQVSVTIDLLDKNNTVPFIARYRKEVTGSLDEVQIRDIEQYLEKFRVINKRRESIVASINDQGKMTPELLEKIQAAESLTNLEDLYQPFRPKRSTRASVARQRGLQGLADWILQQPVSRIALVEIVKPFINESVPTTDEAWAGARDIVAETISDHPEVRQKTRQKAFQWGILQCEKIETAIDERNVYQTYYVFECAVNRLKAYQVLAMNRGEIENILKVRVVVAERDWRNSITSFFPINFSSPLAQQLELVILDAAERLLLPAIERDVRRDLTENAEQHAINVFAANLGALISQPPLEGRVVLGLDPGFRTGCKIAVVDQTGKLLKTETIYPHEPQKYWEKSLKILETLVRKYNITLIAIGNGTACRESELLVNELIKKNFSELKYIITNEAGASVYSASPLARSELPDLDVTLRGAVSIARRVQDPLSELVKIDPKSIGVGLYQHDVNQSKLGKALDAVVESVVNLVGVDVNTASPALLTYVAGIGPKLAEKIVVHRDLHGPFNHRMKLCEINGLGPKAYEQSAGFLRIRGGENPLDASAIHPESYYIAQKILEKTDVGLSSPSYSKQMVIDGLLARQSFEQLATELNCGIPTLKDVMEQLVRPGRDPRLDAPLPILRSDVLKLEDLIVGMKLLGTVRNVVDFGAFVDIGVKQDGLLHRTQIPRMKDLHVGDIVGVTILNIEPERGRIKLGWTEAN